MSAILKARPTLLKLHRWTAVVLGLFIILQALTGTVTAFRHELDRVVDRQAFVVQPGRPAAPVQAVVQALKDGVPGARLQRLDYPLAPDEAYMARLDAHGQTVMATVDPATARVLKQGPLPAWPVEQVYMLHHNLNVGELGERILGFVGLGVLFLALTGPLVWWPGASGLKRAFRVDATGNAWRTTRDLHRLVGVFICLFLAIIAFTGLNMAWRPWLQPLVFALAPAGAHDGQVNPRAGGGGHGHGGRHHGKGGAGCDAPQIDQAIAAARARLGGETITGLRFQGGHALTVAFRAPLARPRAQDMVAVDACTAQVSGVRRASDLKGGDAFYAWLLPIHSGEWLALPGRVIDELAALSLAALGISGYWLWAVRSAKVRWAKALRA